MIDAQITPRAAAAADRVRSLEKPRTDLESKVRTRERANRTDIDDIAGVGIVEGLIFVNGDLSGVTAVEDPDLARLRHVARETDASRAEDAALLVQLHERPKCYGLHPAGLLRSRIAALMARVCHVVVLKPALAGLIAHRAVDRMVQEQKLHGVSNGLLNPRGVCSHDHAIGCRSCAGRHQLGKFFDFDQTHPAAAFDSDVGVIAIARDLNAELVGDLNNGSPGGTSYI